MNLNARNQQQKSRPYQSLADILANDKDRKSTRLNSSHSQISYAVFCLKKKTIPHSRRRPSSSWPGITVCPLSLSLTRATCTARLNSCRRQGRRTFTRSLALECAAALSV